MIVTSALPYANGEIHLGHIASTYLPADIFTNYCRLKGYQAYHICATDDFGTPIMIASAKNGRRPEEYVAYWNEVDRRDFADLGIRFDFFYKTSSRENIELVQYFFKRLHEKGLIYQEEVLQPYCERDREFLPDRYVIGTCPYCGAKEQYSDGCEKCGRSLEPGEIKEPHCSLCGSTPIEKKSLHYFFRLSSFSEKLRNWLSNNERLQPEVRNYVLRWIEDGLKDWDITRDIRWGVPIPLPEARGKVLYGWFDNHLCYISSTLLFLEGLGIDGREFWNSSEIYHFIGKDIVYHHYLFLPAMRLGLDEEYKLPNMVPTRGHLTLHGQKFSKSRGWYLSLREFLDALPADYLRYYLASITPYSQDDVNFDWDDFYARIDRELVANIGNFVHRTLTFTWSRFKGKIPEPGAFTQEDADFRGRIAKVVSEVGERFEDSEIDRALKATVGFSASCNQYFQAQAPWAAEDGAPICIYLCANAVRSLAMLLYPIIPHASERLWKLLNIEKSIFDEGWDSASTLALASGHKISEPEIIFRRLEVGEITRQKAKLAGKG